MLMVIMAVNIYFLDLLWTMTYGDIHAHAHDDMAIRSVCITMHVVTLASNS